MHRLIFAPLIPDIDAHHFDVDTDLTFGHWTISGAFGYEHHEDRDKTNNFGDPAGSALASALNVEFRLKLAPPMVNTRLILILLQSASAIDLTSDKSRKKIVGLPSLRQPDYPPPPGQQLTLNYCSGVAPSHCIDTLNYNLLLHCRSLGGREIKLL